MMSERDFWEFISLLKTNNAILARIESKIDKLNKEIVMADQDVANLVAAVAQETTIDQSAIALINGIAAQIAAAVAAAGSLSAADRASLEAAVTSITTNATALSTAVTANTPAAPVQQTAVNP
jgi:uncharacterized protein YdcH (DUF465 family)